MRMRNYHGKASESDRHVPDMKPKWMVSFGPFLCDFVMIGLLRLFLSLMSYRARGAGGVRTEDRASGCWNCWGLVCVCKMRCTFDDTTDFREFSRVLGLAREFWSSRAC